jgi:hypothetical protein
VYRIWTYNPDGVGKADFWIQSKGEHAGRPLRAPIANCFCVKTENPLLFARVYSLYKGGFFKYHIIGSVVPFIRIGEVRRVIDLATQEPCKKWEKELKTISQIDAAVLNYEKMISTYRKLQESFCYKVNAQLVF